VVFSNPGTLADADKKGKADRYQVLVHDTRFALQQMRRNPSLRPNPLPGAGPVKDRKPNPNAMHKDWSEPLSAGLVNPNTSPAKFSFSSTTSSCTSDFVIYPTGIAGSGTSQATIVAYNELYGQNTPTNTGCGSATVTVPTIDWAYNTAFSSAGTSDNSVVKTSPVLSLDGTQVAFIQVNASVASLILLKPATSTTVVPLSTITGPTPNNVAAASYHNCSAPCMTRLILSGTPNDTWSAPFYDYADDILYVGDDSGTLHKFTTVFDGTPTEVGSGLTLSSGVKLASPVYDSNPASLKVFVGNVNGVLYSVNAGAMTLSATSFTLANAAGEGIYDAPLLDPTAEEVYVFVGNSAALGGAHAV
jgi:hypothetical protein